MNKLVITVCSAALCAVAFGYVKPTNDDVRRKRMKMYGGDIRDCRRMKGNLAVVNAQKTASDALVRAGAAAFTEDVFVDVKFADGAFDIRKPEPKGTLTLFVIDDAAYPMSLVASEARWAVVNVAPLKCEKAPFFEARVKKEMYRVMGQLCGAAATKYDGCIFGAMTKPEDLDQIAEIRLPLEYGERFAKYLPGVGVVPFRMEHYSKACQQGWAPAPTNEYQKVIWEKIKAEANEKPSNPMRIVKPQK